MTFDQPILAAARKGLCPRGNQPGPGAAARRMGLVLAVVLFGVDAFHPIIGLVEVSQVADKAVAGGQATADSEPAQPAPPTVVSIHAWQWHQPNTQLCPAFVFQPTISAGSTNRTGSAGSAASLAAAALPPMPAASLRATPLALRWLAQGSGQLPPLRLTVCREICPIGPPAA